MHEIRYNNEMLIDFESIFSIGSLRKDPELGIAYGFVVRLKQGGAFFIDCYEIEKISDWEIRNEKDELEARKFLKSLAEAKREEFIKIWHSITHKGEINVKMPNK